MIKRKQIKIFILIMIIASVAINFSLVLIKIFNERKKTYPEANSYYTFGSTAVSSEDYAKYKEFRINSLAGLKAFGESVYSVNNLNFTFSGKTVKLMNNINANNATILIGKSKHYYTSSYFAYSDPTFAGSFDGNGFTISNFTLGTDVTSIGGYTVSGGGIIEQARGLFLRVSGSIHNLRIVSVKTDSGVSGEYHGATLTYQAALVGCLNGGTVTNCAVEGFSGATYAAGIIGSSFNGVVINCYAADISSINSYVTSYGIGPNIDKTYATYSSYNYLSASITNCISKDRAVSVLSNSNCYTSTSGEFKELSKSNIGGKGESQPWYYCKEYNSYPILRVFINWKTISFKSNNVGYGNVSLTSIEIPSDANTTYTSKSESIAVYGRVVNATAYGGYTFDTSKGWTYASNTYTANFKAESYNIKLQTITYNGESYNPLSGKDTIVVENNQDVEFKITFDSSNTHIWIGGEIRYTIPLKFTISSFGTIDGTAADLSIKEGLNTMVDFGEDGEMVTLKPEITLKTYPVDKK